MEQPWSIDAIGIVREVVPETWLFGRGDWPAVEESLGLELPEEYKELIGDGRALVFDEELVIASPFDAAEHANLLRVHSREAWGLAYLRHSSPGLFELLLHPEPGGLLCWGTDGGGAAYFYDTRDWTVFVSGRPVPEPGIRYETNLRGYLDGLRDGSIVSESLDEWPGPNPSLRRRPLRADS